MRKLVIAIVSLSFVGSMLGGCATMTPNSAAWSPRDVGESTSAPRQAPAR